jgi:uncharacterized protein YutE (UPF0331/DUF86 family)
VVFRVEAVRFRLQRLEEVISELQRLKSSGRELLRGSLSNMWAVERGLQLGAEIIFDIGNHVLSAEYGTSADDYKDIVRQLVQRGVLDQDLRDRLEGLAGFRNILVHDYLRLDPERVLEALARAPEDFTAFAREIRAWLEKTRP